MAMKYYSGIFGGEQLNFMFRHPDTAHYFGNWITETDAISEPCLQVPFTDVSLWEDQWDLEDDGFTEFQLSIFRVSNALLQHRACVFHGAAFLWQEIAFLITAASGVGKSTQLRNLLKICGNEIRVMNGDKPILKQDGERILVCPSPWKGKERLGDDSLSAPLAGIIFLEQAKNNLIQMLSPHQSVPVLLPRFLSTFETPEIVLDACSLEDAILRNVPVWKLSNRGDLDSTQLLRDTLLQEVFSQ